MNRAADHSILDAALLQIRKQGKSLLVLNAFEADTGIDATAVLAQADLSAGNFDGPEDIRGGRRITCSVQAWLPVFKGGTCSHVAIVDKTGETPIWVTSCNPRVVRAGDRVRPLPWHISIRGPK